MIKTGLWLWLQNYINLLKIIESCSKWIRVMIYKLYLKLKRAKECTERKRNTNRLATHQHNRWVFKTGRGTWQALAYLLLKEVVKCTVHRCLPSGSLESLSWGSRSKETTKYRWEVLDTMEIEMCTLTRRSGNQGGSVAAVILVLWQVSWRSDGKGACGNAECGQRRCSNLRMMMGLSDGETWWIWGILRN